MARAPVGRFDFYTIIAVVGLKIAALAVLASTGSPRVGAEIGSVIWLLRLSRIAGSLRAFRLGGRYAAPPLLASSGAVRRGLR